MIPLTCEALAAGATTIEPPRHPNEIHPMLAYRHAFHAGNHADVLKHIVFARVLRYMNQKDKPYRLIDTHAGAGGYSLEGQYAQKKGEYVEGIGRLWDRDDLPELAADYVELVRRFNPDGRLGQYPGSPAFAQMLLRPGDQLRVFERHPTDHRILASFLGETKGVEVRDSDGFDGLKGQVPPSSRRRGLAMTSLKRRCLNTKNTRAIWMT